MGIFGRFKGKSEPKAELVPGKLNGGNEVRVVGESNYHAAIEKACGGPSRDGVDWECEATLVPEPTNPYDPEAVMVQMEGETVGYLAKAAARAYQPVAQKLAREGNVGVVAAAIRGGWNRSATDKGDYGVTLDMAAPDKLLPKG